MEKQQRIEMLYFTEKKTLTEIANILGISVNCISKRLRKNPNYIAEKEKRKEDNLVKRRKTQKQIIYSNRTIQDVEYQVLQAQLKKDVKTLSKGGTLNNTALRKWCSSAYSWNSRRKAFEFDKNIKKSNDLPQYIRI